MLCTAMNATNVLVALILEKPKDICLRGWRSTSKDDQYQVKLAYIIMWQRRATSRLCSKLRTLSSGRLSYIKEHLRVEESTTTFLHFNWNSSISLQQRQCNWRWIFSFKPGFAAQPHCLQYSQKRNLCVCVCPICKQTAKIYIYIYHPWTIFSFGLIFFLFKEKQLLPRLMLMNFCKVTVILNLNINICLLYTSDAADE